MTSPQRLPTIHIDDEEYFVDTRLRELRNVTNPHDSIDLGDGSAKRFMCCTAVMQYEPWCLGLRVVNRHLCLHCGHYLVDGDVNDDELTRERMTSGADP